MHIGAIGPGRMARNLAQGWLKAGHTMLNTIQIRMMSF
jgi:pyrroline-5-carboxylate reductase